MTTQRWTPIAIAIVAAVLVATGGGLATDIGSWYVALHKPSWQPPDWLFGPVWTTIYTLVVIAGVRGWRRAGPGAERTVFVVLLTVNACVNVLWSVLFFRLHHPDWALLEVGVLWSSVLSLVVSFGRLDRVAGALLTPYLLWVSFASYLNLTIVVLNAPFGR